MKQRNCDSSLRILAMVVGVAWCVGCGSAPDEAERSYGRLCAFVKDDDFGTSHLLPNAWKPPAPRKLPQALCRYIAKAYDSDARVRSQIALYFLRYEALCYSHGLLSHGGGAPGDLIRTLWEQEQGHGFRYPDSPDLWQMHLHIRRNPDWFSLDETSRELLLKNETLFHEYFEYATDHDD